MDMRFFDSGPSRSLATGCPRRTRPVRRNGRPYRRDCALYRAAPREQGHGAEGVRTESGTCSGLSIPPRPWPPWLRHVPTTRADCPTPLAILRSPITIGLMELHLDCSGSQGPRMGGGCTVTKTPDGTDVQLAAASSIPCAPDTAPSGRMAKQAVTLHEGSRGWSRQFAPRAQHIAGHWRRTGFTFASHGSGASVNAHGGQKGA